VRKDFFTESAMFRSIRWRLILSYVFLALLSVGTVGSITYQLAENYAENREIQGLRANAQAIALQAEPLMYSRFGLYELQQLAETSAFLGDIRVRILDEAQRPIADSGITDKAEQVMIIIPSTEGDLTPGVFYYQVKPGTPLELPESITESLPPGTEITVVKRQDGPWGKQFTFEEVVIPEAKSFEVDVIAPPVHYRSDASISYPIGDPADPIGYVQLSEPVDYGTNLLDQLKQALFTAGAGAVVLAVIFGLWNSYRVAAPIKSLASTSAQMGAGDLSVRANLKTGGEIGDLGDQFNQMANNLQITIQQLEDERDALRRFIADASHELRTPITALKNFNTLLQGAAIDDASAQEEFLMESQAQIERLEWITANLLDLSRLDAGLFDLDLAEHNLCEIISASVSPFFPIAEEKGISLITQLPNHPVTQSVDRPRSELAIANLLDNALKFTPAGGEIVVELQENAQQVSVLVRDTGKGISSQDLPYIFERFYRGRDHSLEGSGLGLAIVKSIIEAHGGQINVESIRGQGATFVLDFPTNE
jgi:signal transduction histidine kinase